VGGRQVG